MDKNNMLERIQRSLEEKNKEIGIGSMFESGAGLSGLKKTRIFLDVSGSMLSNIGIANTTKYKLEIAIECLMDIWGKYSNQINGITCFSYDSFDLTKQEMFELNYKMFYDKYNRMFSSTGLFKAITRRLDPFVRDYIIISDGLPDDMRKDETGLRNQLDDLYCSRPIHRMNTIYIPDTSCLDTGNDFMKLLAKVTGGKFYNYIEGLKNNPDDPIGLLTKAIAGFISAPK